MRFEGSENYVATPDLMLAVNAAIRLQRPLLIKGEPILAAIGAGIPIHTAQGNMIINIGGGTSEIAIISLGGVVASHSARVGGNKIEQAIADYIKRKYSLAIGDRTAEEVKMKIGSAIAQVKEDHMEVRSRDLMGGLPKTITIASNEVTEAIQEELREIINVIKQVLQETPPELAADIMDKGMVLSGGTSQLKYLDQLIAKTIVSVASGTCSGGGRVGFGCSRAAAHRACRARRRAFATAVKAIPRV